MIHQYRNNGYNIVLDVNSGSVHVVDDIVYDTLPVVEKFLAEGGMRNESGEDKENGAEKETAAERLLRFMDENASVLGGQRFSEELRFTERYSGEQLREAVEEILELKEAGMLFPAYRPRLQPCLPLLFCRRRRISRKTGAHEL